MVSNVKIEQLVTIEESINDLSELLTEVVNDGASIGFLPPLKETEAKMYWENVLTPDVILLVATINQKIVGSVQLHICSKQNGKHRAEIAKLMIHPDYRRMGIGRLLMQAVEEKAKHERRSLLVLDTREGDISNKLYVSMGYIQAGRIPNYAISASGKLDATIFYYKFLEK